MNAVTLAGRPHHLAIIRDISERKQAEAEKARLQAQLRQAQKMEAIGTLAGGIAHDFNNILTAILGFAELARQDSTPGSQLRDDLDEVMQASLRARELVRQILAFSRSSERQRLPLTLAPQVKEALRLLGAGLPANLEIRQHMADPQGMVLADPIHIHQMVMNLVANAAYAMGDQEGLLEVTLEGVEIDAQEAASHPDLRPGPHMRLTVSDTGRGMEPEVVERIFDPFFTTKKVGDGTGMGLSVVHGIVKEMQGVILVESRPGAGTTFQVLLPRLAPPEGLSAPAALGQ
jgi:signal transduction histidine kinase